MFPKIVIAILVVRISSAQSIRDCTGKKDMRRMLGCMAKQANGHSGDSIYYAFYENEFYTAMNQAANSCEQSSGCDMGISLMGPDEFLKEEGILHGECEICWKVTMTLMNLYENSTTPAVRSCLRRSLGSEITKEIRPCIMRESGIDVPPFTPRQFPDLDYNSEEGDNLQALKESITYALSVYYKNSKQECGPETAKEFLSCFDDMPSYNLVNHCNVNNKCKQNVLQKNRCSIDKLASGACNCFQSHRERAKELAANIITTFDKASDESITKCAQIVYASMVSPDTGRNLLEIGKRLFSTCANIQNLDLSKYLKMACGIVKRSKKESAESKESKSSNKKFDKDSITTIMQLVNALIDSLTQRVSRFCNASACGGDN